MSHVLLLHPPLALPSEPPPGPPAIAGALAADGHRVTVVDASIEALDWLVERSASLPAAGVAGRRLARAWDALHEPATYERPSRHDGALHAAALGLSAVAAALGPYRLSLTDYQDLRRDPFSSDDLLSAAAAPEDHLFAGYVRERLLPRLAALTPAPELVGVSVGYRQQALPAVALAAALRGALPGVPVLAGGGLVSQWLEGPGPVERLLAVFDGLVAGDGAPAIRAWLADGGPTPAAPGLVWRAAPGAPERRNPRPRHDASALAAAPRFDGLPLDRYLAPAPILAVPSSRGCYWRRCAFCPESLAAAEGFAALPGDLLLERLSALGARHGARYVHLADSAVAPRTLRGLATAGSSGALPDPLPRWYGFARFEPLLLDPDVCRGLRAAGCHALQLGLESGSQRLLDLIGKGIRLEDAARILHNLHDAGIVTVVYVLVGLPTETLADAEQTRAFLRAHADAIDHLHASVMNLPIGAPLDRARERYLLPADAPTPDFPGDLSLCRDLRTTGPADRRELRRFLARELLRDPLVRPMVRDLPPQLGANHVLFRAPRS
jgi:hypothetical protein